jgi:hypothetical protein
MDGTVCAEHLAAAKSTMETVPLAAIPLVTSVPDDLAVRSGFGMPSPS